VITHEFSSEDEIQLDISTGPITRDEVNQSAISKKTAKQRESMAYNQTDKSR